MLHNAAKGHVMLETQHADYTLQVAYLSAVSKPQLSYVLTRDSGHPHVHAGLMKNAPHGHIVLIQGFPVQTRCYLGAHRRWQ